MTLQRQRVIQNLLGQLEALKQENRVLKRGGGPPKRLGAAVERYVAVGSGNIELWCRSWGNPAATAVLFVHGGPGNCVADYKGINETFFDFQRFVFSLIFPMDLATFLAHKMAPKWP